MADTTRSAMPVTQALTVGDRAFVGMDTYTDPNKLQDGYCQRITNLVAQNGSLVPRRGWQAQTTTGIGNEYTNAISVKSSRNVVSSAILSAKDTTTTPGTTLARFWKFDAQHGEAVPIPMSASATLTFNNIDASLVRMSQHGRYVYIAPGAAPTGSDSLPLRIDVNTKSQKLVMTAGTDKFTLAGHGLAVGDPFVITVLPTVSTGLSTSAIYYVAKVSGNDVYFTTSLPTSGTTSSVNYVTGGWSGSVTIVTSFKGETVPNVSGLTTTSPVAELYPVVAKAISATAHQTVTTSFALSSNNQLLSNSDFSAYTGGPPSATITNWTQITAGTGTRERFEVIAQSSSRPLSPTSTTKTILRCYSSTGGSNGGAFPGVYQTVNTLPTETYTLKSGTVTEVSALYGLQVVAIAYGPESTVANWALSVRLKALDSSSNEIEGAVASAILKPQISSNRTAWKTYTLIGDFRAFKDSIGTSGKVKVEIQAASDTGTSDNNGLWVDTVRVWPIPNVPKTSTVNTAVDPVTGLVPIYGIKVNLNATTPAPSFGGYVKNRHFYYDVTGGGTVNWSKLEYVSIQFKPADQFQERDLSFSIGLQNGSATSIDWGGEGTYNPSDNYLTFSLRAFDTAARNDVKAVYIRCNQDFLIDETETSAAVGGNVTLFYVGKLVVNGELQAGGQYEYAFCRWKAAPSYTSGASAITFNAIAPFTLTGTTESYFGGIESAISKTSVPIVTTPAQCRVRLSLDGDFRDASGDGYTHLLVYRRNVNTFNDGRFRLIAQIKTYDTTPSLASARPGITLEGTPTQSSIKLLDNLSDVELLFDGPVGRTGHVFRDGKDLFPAGCETIATHQSRIWLSKGNTIYASWLLDNDNEYAFYTTIVPIAGDPLLPIKGASFDVSGIYDYEPITAMVPFSGDGLTRANSTTNALLVLRNNSILPITGLDASNFQVLNFINEPGSGCIAPLSARTVMGNVWWLSNSGIMQYERGRPKNVSVALDRLANARSFNPVFRYGTNYTVNQTAQTSSSSVVFDNKFLFTSNQPGNGNSRPDSIFVYDFNMKGWYEWSFITGAFPVCLFTLNTANDAPDLMVASDTGHVYKYTGTTDKTTAVSAETTFRWVVLSRQYNQTYAQGPAYYGSNYLTQIDLHVQTEASLSMTWTAFNHNQPDLYSPIFNFQGVTETSSGTWTFTPKTVSLEKSSRSVAVRNIRRDMRGHLFSLQLDGYSLTDNKRFRIMGFMLHTAEGGIRRVN